MKEVIIIGTSPLAIAEATLISSLGESVINLDSKGIIGGAWVTHKYNHIPKVEIGCHIWSYNKKTYRFISEFFNLNIIDVPIQPKIVYKNRFIPYSLKSNLITLKRFLRSIIKLDFRIFKELDKHPELRLSLFPIKHKYPKLGAKEIEEAVQNIISTKSLEVGLNSTVQSITLLKEGGGVLFLKNGDEMRFSKEVVLTSLSQLEQIIFEDGSSFEPKSKEVKYIHRHLIVKGTVKKKFSYLRIMNDDLIHRISDMTNQVKEELPEGTFLICAGIHENAYGKFTAEEQEQKIINKLKSLKLFKNDVEVIVSESNTFPSFYVDRKDFNYIASKSGGKIRFLSSTDFVYSFYNQLERYSPLLD